MQNHTGHVWMLTARHLDSELQKPDSPYQKLLNAMQNEAEFLAVMLRELVFQQVYAQILSAQEVDNHIREVLRKYETEQEAYFNQQQGRGSSGDGAGLQESSITALVTLERQIATCDDYLAKLKPVAEAAIHQFRAADLGLAEKMMACAGTLPVAEGGGKQLVDAVNHAMKKPDAEKMIKVIAHVFASLDASASGRSVNPVETDVALPPVIPLPPPVVPPLSTLTLEQINLAGRKFDLVRNLETIFERFRDDAGNFSSEKYLKKDSTTVLNRKAIETVMDVCVKDDAHRSEFNNAVLLTTLQSRTQMKRDSLDEERKEHLDSLHQVKRRP